jgi:UDP-N-acetylglucosamine acyltransferase
VIGDGNYIMSAGHIAHNCHIGNNNVIISGALLAGYVVVEDGAMIAADSAVHQYCRVGSYAMIGGGVRVNQDCPPYFLYGGLYATPTGLNKVGLRRAGFTAEQMAKIKRAYQLLYREGLKLADALTRIETEVGGEHALHLVEFARGTKRGISRGASARLSDSL